MYIARLHTYYITINDDLSRNANASLVKCIYVNPTCAAVGVRCMYPSRSSRLSTSLVVRLSAMLKRTASFPQL
jgi:hypothetical protein